MSDVTRERVSDAAGEPKLLQILEAALDLGALTPVALDIRGLTSFADTFVLLTGRSDRQVRAIADAIVHTLQASDATPLGTEGFDEGHWVLIDCNDVVVHVFDSETRELYALDRLWSDAPEIDLAEIGVPDAALAEAVEELQRSAGGQAGPEPA